MKNLNGSKTHENLKAAFAGEAQFEREIISERTRDKQSAARRKGKWIGGYPMLGYDADPSQTRLVVNEAEAEQVKQIFRIFLRHGALIPALAEINRRGLRMKSWTTEKGRAHIGQSFDRPALARLLANVLYVGEVKHKGKVYPGEQPAIVDRKTWTKVNDLLGGRSRGPDTLERNRQGAILKSILKCAVCGSRMVPGYATNHFDGPEAGSGCMSRPDRGGRKNRVRSCRWPL